mmetsp:Transcript_18804/g.40958  ORF Transcript_18804/g.40958 Transcript_18804/m.40958 type:complete len:274 (-) Transcript_18804:32-853(-)
MTDPRDEDNDVYESEAQLNMYLSLHYPSPSLDGVDPILAHSHSPEHALRFPQRTAQILCSLNPPKMNRALDIGCAVGGASFELATRFDEVEAFDFSESFVNGAKHMQQNGFMSYMLKIEGDVSAKVSAILEKKITKEVRKRASFFTGDACKLEDIVQERNLGTFDAVLLSNLLCRLSDPIACLGALRSIVNTGGVVLILTPYTWLEEFTPKCNWIGGHRDKAGNPVQSQVRLRELMEGLGFIQIHLEQVPLIIREHQRKYQYIVSEATGWRKK